MCIGIMKMKLIFLVRTIVIRLEMLIGFILTCNVNLLASLTSLIYTVYSLFCSSFLIVLS